MSFVYAQISGVGMGADAFGYANYRLEGASHLVPPSHTCTWFGGVK
jgi:hypothetical protein